MAIHRLSIDDFEEDEYSLIAIHTSAEDFHLAYHINRQLSIKLYKCKPDIQIKTKDGDAFFSRFLYEDENHGGLWNLLQNKSEVTRVLETGSNLFGQNNAVSTLIHFIPDFKRVDYFLKVENQEADMNYILENLKKIAKISTVYPLDVNQIKSKNNLIF